MRVVPYVLILAAISLGTTGCALFGGNSSKTSGGGGGKWWLQPPNSQAPRNNSKVDPLVMGTDDPTSQQIGGLLAGRVIGPDNDSPSNTYVRWTSLEGENDGASIDVKVSPEGYFTIQGVDPGKQYKLVARSQLGNRVLAGTVYATAPSIRLVIKLKEQAAGTDIPAIPGPPEIPGRRKKKKQIPNPNNAADVPGMGTVNILPEADTKEDRGFNIGRPNPLEDPPQPKEQEVPGWDTPPQTRNAPKKYPENIAQGQPNRHRPPTVRIKPWVGNNQAESNNSQPFEAPGVLPPPPMEDQNSFTPQNKVPLAIKKPSNMNPSKQETPVPSCVLVGNRLINFALSDLQGNTWEWKRHRLGKLVLLDFWSTNCVPCLIAIPHLRDLQARFGYAGLEVIGIANENSGSLQQKKNRIARVCHNRQTNYRLLMGTGANDPVLNQFGVRVYPTMVLLDERGTILWRHEGALTRRDLDGLERFIQMRLNVQ